MRRSLALLLLVCSGTVVADDNEQLNAIYKAFMTTPVDVEYITSLYHPDVIHVGHQSTPLLRGVDDFIETNITPMAEAINTGTIAFTGRAYVMRRTIVGDMANDVGYLHATAESPERGKSERLQKFSWVFVKEGGKWRVLTDFDAQTAPLELLEGLEPEFFIE